MATEFTDISSINHASTPSKANNNNNNSINVTVTDKSVGSASKKQRNGTSNNSKLRLSPLDSSAPYEMPNTTTLLSTQKLKKITQKKELIEAVRKANSPIVLLTRETLFPIGGTNNNGMSSHAGGAAGAGAGGGGNVAGGVAGGGGGGAAGAAGDPSKSPDHRENSSSKDIEFFEDGVNTNARRYNEQRMLADRKQKEIAALLDEYRSVHLETLTLQQIHNHETPSAKRNSDIQQNIDTCLASMEDQMHLRRQLEHMIRRLQTCQLRVDAQIEAMSRTVDTSLGEAEEVKLLCRQLEAGKSRAVQFLQDMQGQIQVERKQRARELSDTQIRARNAQKMELWRVNRIHERAEMAAELRGDLSAEEEAKLLRSIESRERANAQLHLANQAKSQKATDFEDVLDQLKLATGAMTLQTVVEKIASQSTTYSSLEKEKTQAEARLVVVRSEKEKALQELNDLKASGIGGIELNREVYNTLENEILQAKTTLKVNKAAFERLDGVISAVHQGSSALAVRLQTFDDVLQNATTTSDSHLHGSSHASGGGGTGTNSANALAGVFGKLDANDPLAIAETKLLKIVEIVGQQNSAVNTFNAFGGENEEQFDETNRLELESKNSTWSPTQNNDPVMHANNIRVKPSWLSISSGSGSSGANNSSNTAGNNGSQSSVGVGAGPGAGGVVDESAIVNMLTSRSDTSSRSDSNESNSENIIPSREILKMSSSRHFAEVMRKKEMVERQRLAAEKGISDEEMVIKLRKRNQVEADRRLATSPTKNTGIIIKNQVPGKDEDTTKTVAFVTQLSFNDL